MDYVPIGSGGNIWGMLKNLESTPWKQLGEFIDNSLSSWMTDQDGEWPIKIDIIFDPHYGTGDRKGRLIIKDNALGISEEQMLRAFDLGNIPSDLDNPKNLNQFGVGMKVAACWFGNKWAVQTSALGEPSIKTVNWNLDQVMNGKLTELPVTTRPTDPEDHFTIITITDLVHSPDNAQTIGKIKRFIPKIFRKYIETGLVTITWNGEELIDSPEEVLTAPWYKDVEKEVDNPEQVRWETDFELDLGRGIKLDGYACLFEKWDKQHTGLNYFWKNRLIQGNIEPFYRPVKLFAQGNSFRTGRLYIEIDCDLLKVTNNKGAIDWNLSMVREDDLIDALQKILKTPDFPLLQQGENHRNIEPDIAQTRIDTTMDFVRDRATEFGQQFIESQTGPIPDAIIPSIEENLDLIADRVITHVVDGHQTNFRVACVTAGPRTPWITIEWGHPNKPEHEVLLNLNHPFVQKHLTNDTLPIFIGFGVSLLYGEYKTLSFVEKDELRLLRQFTDRFMRYMATQTDMEIENDTED